MHHGINRAARGSNRLSEHRRPLFQRSLMDWTFANRAFFITHLAVKGSLPFVVSERRTLRGIGEIQNELRNLGIQVGKHRECDSYRLFLLVVDIKVVGFCSLVIDRRECGSRQHTTKTTKEVEMSENTDGGIVFLRRGRTMRGLSIAAVVSCACVPVFGHAETNYLEEVVVTAQKREERLQDVPIAISVLNGDTLDKWSERSVVDALGRVPGVSASQGSANRIGTAGVTVRGVTPLAGQSPTGYYLDMIPFGFVRRSIAPDASAYDLERVEVLKGPQGTLYGVNALSGVVRVLTTDAKLEELEFKGRVSASATESGGENYRGDIALNLPIIDGKLAARAVVGYQDWNGWIDNSTFGKNNNDFQDKNIRLKVQAKPADRLSVSFLGWVSRNDSNATSNSADNKINTIIIPEPRSNDIDAAGLEIGYELPAVSIRSMTSYVDYENRSVNDAIPLVIIAHAKTDQLFGSEVFSQEIILSSAGVGPWRWSLGGLYRDAEDDTVVSTTNPFTGAFLFSQAPTVSVDTSESYAVFGELTRAFFDGRLDLTAGLRYFEDRIEAREISRSSVVGGIPATGLVTVPGKFDKLTSRFVLTWHPSAQATVYASYSEGFRSGLNQSFTVYTADPTIPQAEPDELKNYEVGAKATVLDGSVGINAALYYIDWEHIQQSLQVRILNGASIAPAFVNEGSASGFGVDFGISIVPVTNLVIGASIGWNDLTFDKNVIGANGATTTVGGARLLGSPETTLSFSADYSFPIGGSGLQMLLSASANYTSEIRTVGTTAPGTANFYRDSIWMARASTGIEFPGRRWTAIAFVDNLTNQDGFSQDAFTPQWNTWARPRTIGVQLENHF